MARFTSRRAARISLFETACVGSQDEFGLFFWRTTELGFEWKKPGNGCGLSVVGLRSVDQDVHVGQLAGEGHLVEMPVK